MYEEVETAARLISEGNPDRFFESPYLITTLYYSESFLYGRSARRTEPALRITHAIRDMVSVEIRARYIEYLKRLAERSEAREALQRERAFPPLPRIDSGRGINHENAIDLFAFEGTFVRAIYGGVVVLAEGVWRAGDPFSVSSPNCGNSIIIYNSYRRQFFRYCHLKDVFVKAKDVIEGGTIIGSVGSTGTRASREGHGDHLHLEIHQYDTDEKKLRALTREEIQAFLPALY